MSKENKELGASPDGDRAVVNGAGNDWRPLAGYEGFYEVSAKGEVRSLHFDPPRPVSTRYVNKDGYRLVTLTRGPYQRKICELHRLVCASFHGPAPSSAHEADHIDRDRGNAAAANLRWLPWEANRKRALQPRKRGPRSVHESPVRDSGCAQVSDSSEQPS